METPEVAALYTFKQSANEHLKSKQFSQASVYFADILTKLEKAMEKIETQEDMQKIIREIKLPSHKNLSLCFLKMNENIPCVTQCEEVLKIEPNCLKTLYRISKAYMALKQYDQAQRYLKRGFAIDPTQEEFQKALSQIEAARNPVKTTQQPFLSLKNLIALILYYPLLIFNYFLSLIFGPPQKSAEKSKKN